MKTKDQVLNLLRNQPELRESVGALIKVIVSSAWCAIYPDLKFGYAYYDHILELQDCGRIPKDQCIRRYDRHWKKVYPELRGKNYAKNKKKEKEVREEYS